MIVRKGFGTKRSIEALVSRRSVMVRRTASRMLAKLDAKMTDLVTAPRVGDRLFEIAVGNGARLAAQLEERIEKLPLQAGARR